MKPLHTSKADETPEMDARTWLETVVSARTAFDIIAHRKAKRCALTARAAKVIAFELGKILQIVWQYFRYVTAVVRLSGSPLVNAFVVSVFLCITATQHYGGEIIRMAVQVPVAVIAQESVQP